MHSIFARLLAATVFCASVSAQAQLFVGADDTAIPGRVGNVSGFPTVSWAPIFNGFEVWGAAFNPESRVLYFNDFDTVYAAQWPAYFPGQVCTTLFNGVSRSVTGLAYGNSKLYGWHAGSTAAPASTRGIYEINLVTGDATLVVATPNFDFGGIDFNATDGLIYGANDSLSATGGRGLFKIDPILGSITKVANYPASQTDLDGLAVGGGHAYLMSDDTGVCYRYDLAQGTGGTYQNFSSPFSTVETFSGAAWITPTTTTRISGRAFFSDWSGPRITSISLGIVDPVTQAVVTSVNAPLDAGGYFSVESPIPAGSYSITIKKTHWLRRTVGPVELSTNPNVNLTMINGDIDFTNVIDVGDYLILAKFFDKSSADTDWLTPDPSGDVPVSADLNGDNVNDLTDYLILVSNFDQYGD